MCFPACVFQLLFHLLHFQVPFLPGCFVNIAEKTYGLPVAREDEFALEDDIQVYGGHQGGGAKFKGHFHIRNVLLISNEVEFEVRCSW